MDNFNIKMPDRLIYIKKYIDNSLVLKASLNNAFKRLELLQSKHDGMVVKPLKSIDIAELKQKLINDYENQDKQWTTGELRKIATIIFLESSGIVISEEDKLLKYYFSLLERQWHNKYLTGLLSSIWSYWYYTIPNFSYVLNRVSKFLNEKTDLKKANLFFKNHKEFLSWNMGGKDLGGFLYLKNIPPIKWDKYIGISKSQLYTAYFVSALMNYYRLSIPNSPISEKTIQELSANSERLFNEKIKKYVFSLLILHFQKNKAGALERKLRQVCYTTIGDPNKSDKWTTAEYEFSEEKNIVNEGRKIMKIWITQEFINVFFEQCINAPDRKLFWLKYADVIEDFRVAGSSILKAQLLSNSTIGEFVENRFIRENIKRRTDAIKAAFVFTIKKFSIVEYSDEGDAAYFFDPSFYYHPNLEEKFIHKVEELKGDNNGDLPMIVTHLNEQITGYNQTGRLIHKNLNTTLSWEYKTNEWFKRIVNIYI